MHIVILNTSLETVAVIDSFKSIVWTERYNGYGDFELYLPLEGELPDYIKLDYYVLEKDSDKIMIIENIEITADSEDGDELCISGRSFESVLDRRIVWNVTTLNGSVQYCVKKLLNDNVISPSISNRKISNFIFEESTDTNITDPMVMAQYTGDNLYDVITSLCTVHSLGFKVALSSTDQFAFNLYSGVDRSFEQIANPYIVFSPYTDNLLSTNYFESNTDSKTITLVAGEGEGASRKTTTVSASSGAGAGLSRRELYTDARDIQSTEYDEVSGEEVTLSDSEYTSLLAQRGTEDLADYHSTKSFEGEVEAGNQGYLYREDYNIGDIVQVVDQYGHSVRARITEVVMSESESGYEEYPTFENIEEEGDKE